MMFTYAARRFSVLSKIFRGHFVYLTENNQAIHYWWVPDSTFVSMLPDPLLLPRHSASAWYMGDKRTAGAGTYAGKLASPSLRHKARKVQDFVSNMNFELSEMQDLLFQMQAASTSQVACKWIREQRTRWTAWKPVKTDCHLPHLRSFALSDDFFDFS